MNISGRLSWMDQLQKPNRLDLFVPLSSLVDLVVVVRVPSGFAPFVVPVFCCILDTVASTVLEMSCSQLGSSSGGIVLVKFCPTFRFGGSAICVGVCMPRV